MMKQKYTLIMYLFTLIRNIQLLFNGYSNKLTGFWLIVNMIFILIFYIRLLFKNQKFNEYIIGFILGFTFFSIDFSSFRDYNKRFNTWIIVILILLIFLQFLMLIKIFIKNKKYKEIFSIFKLNNEDRKNIAEFVKNNGLYLLVILIIVISNLLFNYKLF